MVTIIEWWINKKQTKKSMKIGFLRTNFLAKSRNILETYGLYVNPNTHTFDNSSNPQFSQRFSSGCAKWKDLEIFKNLSRCFAKCSLCLVISALSRRIFGVFGWDFLRKKSTCDSNIFLEIQICFITFTGECNDF